MPGKRLARTNLFYSAYVKHIIIVCTLLLTSYVHVEEAKPPSEHNNPTARWQDARGPSARRSDAKSNIPTAAQASNVPDSNVDDISPSMIWHSNKLQSANHPNNEEGPIFFPSGDATEASGDGSLEDSEVDDDNEDGDEDDYNGRTDSVDPGSGSHESKDVAQPGPPIRVPPSSQNAPDKGKGEMSQLHTLITTSVNSIVPNSTLIGNNKPSTILQNLPTVNTVSKLTDAISAQAPTITPAINSFAPPFFASNSTTSTPKQTIIREEMITTSRPWSLDMSDVTRLPNSSFDSDGIKLFGNSSNDYEDEEEEDEDDDNSNFEDNIPSEAEHQQNISKNVDHLPSKETSLTLVTPTSTFESIATTTTDFTISTSSKPDITVINRLSSTTVKPISNTNGPITSTSRPTSLATSSSYDKVTSTASNEDETDSPESSADTDEEEDGDESDDDEDEDDYDEDGDDLDDIDSDISELATTPAPTTHDKSETSYPNGLNIITEEYAPSTTTPPTQPPIIITTTTTTTSTVAPSTYRPQTSRPDIFMTQGPPVIMGSRIDELIAVHEIFPNIVSRQKNIFSFEFRSLPFFAQPILILLVLGGIVTGLFVAILIVMFIVYKLRRQQEI